MTINFACTIFICQRPLYSYTPREQHREPEYAAPRCAEYSSAIRSPWAPPPAPYCFMFSKTQPSGCAGFPCEHLDVKHYGGSDSPPVIHGTALLCAPCKISRPSPSSSKVAPLLRACLTPTLHRAPHSGLLFLSVILRQGALFFSFHTPHALPVLEV